MLASSRICSAPMDTRSSAYNSELTSLMRKALRKPQSRRRERSKRSMDVLGSCMQIRSRSMRTRVNLRRDQTFGPPGHLDGFGPCYECESQLCPEVQASRAMTGAFHFLLPRDHIGWERDGSQPPMPPRAMIK